MDSFKKQLIRDSVILGVLIVLFFVFSYLFRLNIEHKVSIISDLKNQKAILSQSSQNLSLLIKDWDIAKNYKDAVRELVPRKDELVALSKDLQVVAARNNVTLDFSFGKESNPPGGTSLGSIGFNASVRGSAQNIITFLEDLENTYYAMKIGSVEIVESGGGSQASLSGQMFFVL